jgi:hypothetical protein
VISVNSHSSSVVALGSERIASNLSREGGNEPTPRPAEVAPDAGLFALSTHTESVPHTSQNTTNDSPFRSLRLGRSGLDTKRLDELPKHFAILLARFAGQTKVRKEQKCTGGGKPTAEIYKRTLGRGSIEEHPGDEQNKAEIRVCGLPGYPGLRG